APWLRSGPGRCEALASRACLVAVNPARGPGPRGARSDLCPFVRRAKNDQDPVDFRRHLTIPMMSFLTTNGRYPTSADSSSLAAASLAGLRKMATNFLPHEKIWLDKFKYDHAERRFYEQMNGPVAGASGQENGASVILHDIARARENIPKSLAGNSGPGASSGACADHSELVVRIASLKVKNQSLRGVVQELQRIVSKLEARLNVLGKSSPGHRATAPQTQHMSSQHQVEPQAKKPATPAEDDEDDDIDMFGSDNEEEDKKAAQLREERLQQPGPGGRTQGGGLELDHQGRIFLGLPSSSLLELPDTSCCQSEPVEGKGSKFQKMKQFSRGLSFERKESGEDTKRLLQSTV
ncbi:hypothetical protein H8959_012384, partial [Pygathrix nigripes]